MADWEFLIQRQGDRGWRSIETGNLQLMEGKYRIVANSQLFDTQIQLRITHQTSTPAPQRRSRSCQQTSNATGLIVILPFTHLQSGIWQFVCSGSDTHQNAWHHILKLRVLSRQPAPSAGVNIAPTAAPTPTQPPQLEPANEAEIGTPTAPLTPISIGAPESWADGLDRLLAQLERESLEPQPPAANGTLPVAIQLNKIVASPSQLINLTRSTFSGLIPGNRLTIAGECNLQLLNPNLVRSTKVEKLSICLRHPQTAEIVRSIECTIPTDLNIFAFRGQIELPVHPKIGLLLGAVSLYDKHHIQLGSSGFTIALNLNPFDESELSLLQLFDRDKDDLATNLDRLTQELKTEVLTIGHRASPRRPHPDRSPIVATPLSNDTAADPTTITPASPRFDRSAPTDPPRSFAPKPPVSVPTTDLADELDIDFTYLPLDLSPQARNYPNLEIVIDD
jgi:hypothetical protein